MNWRYKYRKYALESNSSVSSFIHLQEFVTSKIHENVMFNPTRMGQMGNTMHKLTYSNKLTHLNKLHNSYKVATIIKYIIR